jgi:putative membrane protein
MTSGQQPPRRPRAFDVSDPAVVQEVDELAANTAIDLNSDGGAIEDGRIARPTATNLKSGFRWGALFFAAMFGLATLSFSVSFANFVAGVLTRNDWIGWTAAVLAGLAAVAALVIIMRELIGLLRLGKLSRFRRDAEKAIADNDPKKERAVVRDLTVLLANRPDLRWGIARLKEHQNDVRDPGDLLRLADREVLAPLDAVARRTVLASAKRVATVTALSPMMLIAMGFVLVENLRLLRALATLYGGRPGGLGALKLANYVVGHIIATGGVAMTDDLLGQFFGQDMLRRLSRRLGEGAFNGALTARIGVAAIEVIRPLPFLDATPIRIRDLLPEILKRTADAAATEPAKPKP